MAEEKLEFLSIRISTQLKILLKKHALDEEKSLQQLIIDIVNDYFEDKNL